MNVLFLRGRSLEIGKHETLRLHIVQADLHVDANIHGIRDLFEEDMDYEEEL